MSTELTLQNAEQQFSALQKAAQDIADMCDKIQINDPTTLAIAHQQLSLVNEKYKQIEAVRVEFKQPFLDAGRTIDSLAKPLLTPLTDALARGKAKILAWEVSQRKEETPEQPTEKPRGLRKTWAFDIVNVNEIPRGFLKPDEAKIQAYLDENKQHLKDGEIKAGIKFYQKESIVLR